MCVMTIEQAKEMDIVDYLSSIGHQPQKISGHNYWYLSPLHEEKTASFKVNRKLNRWYDFPEGKGGNLVDFGILYHQLSVSDFLRKLDSNKLSVARSEPINRSQLYKETENQIKILSADVISSFPLIRYYRSRRIADEIASKYLREVRYQNGDKTFYALGFKNDSDGYELRNEYSKVSSMPKDITFINNGAESLAVFEGFFDFLSYHTMYHKRQEPERNFLILNSTAFFQKQLPKMQAHKSVHLYLDNDKTGQKFTLMAQSVDKQKYIDERQLYRGYNDLNEWLQRISLSQKQQLKLGR